MDAQFIGWCKDFVYQLNGPRSHKRLKSKNHSAVAYPVWCSGPTMVRLWKAYRFSNENLVYACRFSTFIAMLYIC